MGREGEGQIWERSGVLFVSRFRFSIFLEQGYKKTGRGAIVFITVFIKVFI